MRHLKTLIASGVITALAVAAMAVPASAATKGHATIVNGNPRTKVDVCIGRAEIRSNLKYGGAAKKRLDGKKRLTFRKAARGECRGRVLAARTVRFPSGSDKTVVLTSKRPDKVVVWDNLDLGTQIAVGDPVGALAIRHAANLPNNTVHFNARHWKNIYADTPYLPSAVEDPYDFTKGMQRVSGTVLSNEDIVSRVMATRRNNETVLAKSPIFKVEALRRYELIFVGTSAANAKLVMVTSVLSASPSSTP